jgi:hypothetical protein
VSSLSESDPPGPVDDGRRRLRPPREPRRRRLRTTTPSSPPALGAGPPSPCSGRATATGSSETGRASGTLSSDMEPFPRVARWDSALAPGGRRTTTDAQRGARSRMVVGAVGARIDLVRLRDVMGAERDRSDPPLRRRRTSPPGQQSQGEDRSRGRRQQSRIAGSRSSWSGGLDRLGQQRFSPRPEGLHHVGASLAVGTAPAPVALRQVRATLAARPTEAKLATIDDPP